MKTQVLAIDEIITDGDTQARVSINEDTVDEYAEMISDSKDWPFPPCDVFHDGTNYFAADGFHRVLAGHRSKRASIPCRVHKGTAKDARIFGMTANDKHGLRMTRADKRACIDWLIEHGGKLTQKEIAEKAGVSRRMVQYVFAEKRGVQTPEKAQFAPSNGKTGKDGENSSETGKPGGASESSSQRTPVEDGPAASESAREPEPEEDGGGDTPEAVPADPEQEFRDQRSKTVKTAEALMRAFDDLNELRDGVLSESEAEAISESLRELADQVDVDVVHSVAISLCKCVLRLARGWE